MAKGISIHVGLDYVDENHYGTSMRLPYCSNDAREMQKIAKEKGFKTHLLLNEVATTRNFLNIVLDAAEELEFNDILFISLSGHGSMVQDSNRDEDDGYDETFLMYDEMIIDDQLALMWVRLKKGVRVLVISDSCHSGTLVKDPDSSRPVTEEQMLADPDTTMSIVQRTYHRHQQHYDAIFKNIPPRLQTPIYCSVLLLAACQDREQAGAGKNSFRQLSTYTTMLIDFWNNGRMKGNYHDLHTLIRLKMLERRLSQHPNYSIIGAQNRVFENQRPFTI